MTTIKTTKRLKRFFIGALVLSVAFSYQASAETTPRSFSPELVEQAKELMDKGLQDKLAYEVIESLTTEIGPRLGGSPQEAKARAWGVEKFKELGFTNIRIEPFEVSYWERATETARIVSPFPQALTITALGSSVATPKGGVEAQIVRFESLHELETSPMTGLEGKIVFVDEFMNKTQNGAGYGIAVRKRSGAAIEAGKRGAVAAMIRSVGTTKHRFPHTGMMRYNEDVPKVPIVALSAPDADQLVRALKRDDVVVHLEIDVKTKAKAMSGNVIGEIQGETDELVVIGGHLDSWDLGTGAVDDGAGIGITVAAAKLIEQYGKKPKRTIRVIMWGAEEIGLVGAYAYAKQHADELDKHFVASESDFGSGKIWRVSTNFAEDKLGYGLAFRNLFARFGLAQGNNKASGGPDVIPLSNAGVPALRLDQNGMDYFNLHHTPDDTFDKIVLEDIQQNVALWSGFIWVAANMEGNLRSESE